MPSVRETAETWNRKLHFYLGLYFLMFLWLFSFTGLMLNHPKWRFTQFWPSRQETTEAVAVRTPAGSTPMQQAVALAAQLEMSGEIDLLNPEPAAGQIEFRVSRPGRMAEVRADFDKGTAAVKRIQLNGWGVLHTLHTFSGVRRAEPMIERNWFLTSVWSFSMDALAAGLLFMVFSSFYMWYRLPKKRRLGLIALASGIVCCGFFLFLPWWFQG